VYTIIIGNQYGKLACNTYNLAAIIDGTRTIIIILCTRIHFLSLNRGESTSSCHGAVRLVNGANAREGRVEICIHGTWNTVCDDYDGYWYHSEASTVCAQLGYSREGK
jgi:hypothetical protein